jgi:hypothetical protein
MKFKGEMTKEGWKVLGKNNLPARCPVTAQLFPLPMMLLLLLLLLLLLAS